MKTYPVRVTFRPKGKQQPWLIAKWPQVAPSLSEARQIAILAVNLNGCEWGRLDILVPTTLEAA